MNKEIIKTYKKEFDYWLNGGKLMIAYSSEDEWDWLPLKPSWKNTNSVYVIDDEYVLLREALAEGKTIQYLPKDSNKWQDCIGTSSPSREFPDKLSRYRIKPDEHKFKVGDWVTHPEVEGPFKYSIHDTCQFVKPWHPKKGEWCWFYDNQYIPCLKQYYSTEPIGNCHISVQGMMSGKIEPFIGELPTSIKESK